MMSKRHKRKLIANFEGKSVALFLTLTFGAAMGVHAQAAGSPFVIGGTKPPPAASSTNGKAAAKPVAPTAKDEKATKEKVADKDAKAGDKTALKVKPHEVGKSESGPKPKTGDVKH